MLGKLTVTYELAIPDIEVLDPGPFTKQIGSPKPWTAALQPSEQGLTLTVDMETDNPDRSFEVAHAYAQRLAEYLTFQLCDHLKHAVVATYQHRRFQRTDTTPGATTLYASPAELSYASEAPTVRITTRYAGSQISALLDSFGLSLAAQPPATANDLVIARQMFMAALNVGNPVARFLIIYSALAVLPTFKTAVKGKLQFRIDEILRAEDPSIPMVVPPGRNPETEFTNARNDFIHAEDRGRNPAAAVAAIEALTPKFQTLACRILRKG